MLLYCISIQFLRQDLSWNMELTDLARLVGQQSPEVPSVSISRLLEL